MSEPFIPYASGRKGKYGNRPMGAHASKKEHRRALELRVMQRAGLISDLREQVPFVLIPSQYEDPLPDNNGRPACKLIERACKYVADFVYSDARSGRVVVEDTKGVRTKDYVIKRKLMLWIHGIRIREI